MKLSQIQCAELGELSKMHSTQHPVSPSHPNPTVYMDTLPMLLIYPATIISLLTPKKEIAILTTFKIQKKPSSQDSNINFPENHTEEGLKPPEDTIYEDDSDN
jgi:hypothetical protein